MTSRAEFKLRILKPGENIPYSLLLLADETKEGIDSYIHHSAIYVVEYNDEMIAVCATAIEKEGVMEIKNIAVREDNQNKGVGYWLLLEMIKKAREEGCFELIIGTADCAKKQLYLYKKAGFRFSRVIKDFYIQKYPMPIYENGKQLKDMVILTIAV